MAPWLTYSLLVACAMVLGFAIWVSRDGRAARWRSIAKLSVALKIGAVVGAYLVLRPGAGDDGMGDLAAASAAGKPIFIDVYSNF